ncbi:zeta toxin family protein [Streptomyces koyangensis]
MTKREVDKAGGPVENLDACAVLSARESQDVLEHVILPAATEGAVPRDHPVVVIVGGQPGAGKTEIADWIQAALDRRGGAVRVCRDLYKAVHRHYTAALAADIRTAGAKVRPDTGRWQAEVEECVRAQRLDAVVESALADVDEFRTVSASYRRSRHRIEIVVVATAEAWSQLGTLDRLLDGAVNGGGARYVAWDNLDTCVTELPATLAVIETERLADRITVVRRDGTVLYDNELLDGTWQRRTAADKAVVHEQRRPWSAQETAVFHRALAHAEVRVHRDLPEDERLAVHRDVGRAAALAEPVRRIAQPRRLAPGLDYHRLSAAEHRWIFDELIVPSHLSGIVPREAPRAVYVLGQPGAGKTATARMVRRALPGAVRLVGDDFKAAHPDYFGLLRDDPRGAGAAIRADYRAWFTEAEAYVRARRGDVVIEAAPGSREDFLASARPFAAGGYQVELVVLAVRAPDSRLATALRYARAQQLGLSGRFTSQAGHDQCYRALADIVQSAADHVASAAALTVLSREGRALLRQEPGGRAATWALAAERYRPYTDEEAVRFLQLHRALRRALPRYRAELDEIAALARPLMPAPVQQPRIAAPGPPTWPLPLPHGYGSVSSFSRAA